MRTSRKATKEYLSVQHFCWRSKDASRYCGLFNTSRERPAHFQSLSVSARMLPLEIAVDASVKKYKVKNTDTLRATLFTIITPSSVSSLSATQGGIHGIKTRPIEINKEGKVKTHNHGAA